jgi:hydrogenase-4 component E
MTGLAAQGVALGAGTLLLTAVLLVWRAAARDAARLLALQGAALAVLVLTIGLHEREPELIGVAVLVLAVKAVLVPWAVHSATGQPRLPTPVRMSPATSLLATTVLTTIAFWASRPVVAAAGTAAGAVPVGFALVLIGFQVMLVRRDALAQLIGFVVVDNGIATVAFLATGGVPLVVELGVTLDVVLVVLILRVLLHRIQDVFGGTDLEALQELAD